MYDDSIESFLRAERYMGGPPDLVTNLPAGAGEEGRRRFRTRPVVSRSALLALSVPCATRAAAATISFAVLWIALTLRTLGLRHLTGGIAIVAAAFFIVLGSSVATSLHEEATAPRPLFTLLPPTH